MIIVRKAVLIIHGFAGGTYDEEELAFHLQKNYKFDVYQITLPGHEKRSFKKIKYNDWIEYSEKKIEQLINYGYDSIYLVGHSMGGVIATYLANKYHQVKKLVLAAPAFNYITMQNNDTLELLKGGVNLIKNNEKDEIVSRFMKLPLSTIGEFKNLVEKYKEEYKKLSIPTLILHGDNDTVVPIASSKVIIDEINTNKKELIVVEKAGHDLFKNCKIETLNKVENFLKR